MLTRYFLRHPRLAQVIALVIVICGLLCLPLLPTLEYPQVTPPQIEVRATYVGATADQVERAVATPIEQEVNGVENLLYLSSQSASDGSMRLTATFKPNTNSDIAALTVQNRVERAKPWLPQEVLDYGIITQKSFSTQLMFINLYSSNPEHDSTWLSNYASLHLKDALARLPGVGHVDILGKQDYSLRIWMDSARMTSLGLTPADIEAAVRDQNRDIIAGKVGQPPGKNNQQLEYALQVNGLLTSPEEFENIILRKASNDKVLKLGDVARIEQGAENYNVINRLDEHSAIHLAIYQEPDANGLNVSKVINAEMERLSKRFPEGVNYMIPHDISTFVKETIKELQVALFLTIALVTLVIYLFLSDWRATLIPIVAIPVSLIGSFAVLYGLGYSLNTVTLFGLVLAVGIVVDDAIIVVENVQRQISENHLKPFDAVTATMKEVTAPVIATTLVLIAVFLPIGFIPGTSGQFYKEFGVATSSAVLISSLCALTLSPVMCAALLRESTKSNIIQTGLKRVLTKITSVYLSWVAFLLKNLWLTISLLLIASALTLWLFKSLPKGFIPNDDRGFFFIALQLPDSHALNRTDQVTKQVNQILMNEPEIEHTISATGLSLLTFTTSPSAAMMVAILKPWEQRKKSNASADAVVFRIQKKLNEIEGARALAIVPSAIPAISSLGGFDYKLQDQNNHCTADLSELLSTVLNAAQQQPEILYAFSSYRANEPRIHLEIDRNKLRNQGIDLASVHDALHSHLGSKYIDKYHKFGRIYQIKMQSDFDHRTIPDDIEAIHVKNDKGKMVPLATLVNTQPVQSPSTIEHYNLYRTATILGQPSPGYSPEEAMQAMDRISKNLPDGYDYDWSGLSLQQRESGKLTAIVLLLAILFAYLFLVAQLESWTIPIAVIVSIPLSLAGALAGIYISGLDNNIYVQLGLILLIGLAAKNAILIVEFAKHRELQGETTPQAALTAAKLRFRAVMMTGLSFILGVMPLLISSGAGATGRASLGTPIFWGMMSVAVFSTLLTPAFYLCVSKARYPFTKK